MPLSNRFDLPEEIVKALTRNRYIADEDNKKTDYSVTSLYAPAQQVILKKRYPEEENGDVIDNVWAMFGSIAHSLLEEHGSDEAITENRFYMDVLGKTISGQADHIKDGCLTDYKTTSAYKVQKGEVSEWEKQLNCYKYLAEHNGYAINTIRIIAIIRDWSESDAIQGNGYPKSPIMIIPINVWPTNETKEYIQHRVQWLIKSEALEDKDLPECLDSEMWATPTKWAVYKTLDSKRASRVFDTEQEAIDFNTTGHVIERKGERRRCLKYCNVNMKCAQFAKYMEERNGNGPQSPEGTLF
jgi:hypothetical protein